MYGNLTDVRDVLVINGTELVIKMADKLANKFTQVQLLLQVMIVGLFVLQSLWVYKYNRQDVLVILQSLWVDKYNKQDVIVILQ